MYTEDIWATVRPEHAYFELWQEELEVDVPGRIQQAAQGRRQHLLGCTGADTMEGPGGG